MTSGRLSCAGLAGGCEGPIGGPWTMPLPPSVSLDRAGSPVATLSGGQQRRALVARALAGRGRGPVLDEPLAGVDLEPAGAGRHRRRARGRWTTIIVVLHELGPLAPLITRVARLEAGAIVSDGPPSTSAEALGHGDEDPISAGEPAPGVGPWP